ncbi:hypothetical protein Gogos_017622 [Gossypium gossypioides]|uniref:Phosphoacetylglucosamine mutase AMG1 domain-containing protein n=1 Tax=Gossypium gossypioides TaxID=34282 RepID=A0A7J9BBP8_GOSGO|nr:hypothetical protein [Gossypium gossypioides]
MGQQGSGQMHPSLNQQFTELGYWLLQDWCYILVFNGGVGADYVQKEKVVPRGIGSNDVGLRCAISSYLGTAYANGASADYLKQLGLEVIFTPTGVKHLHEKAAQFDIGILVVLKAALRLLSVRRLINQAVGDALSCLLLVKVVDRTAVATINAETVAIRPPGIQEAIDAETGTEDVIPVYAEASTQEAADSLASSVAKIVDRFLGFGTSQQ